ncbi:hypothetical protein PENSPDRAFT_105066 [Peniophora sp. CONT]|nr:hypothetical protein PENSPDRAFT_105066 [Peniophora sp. CONT]
MSTSSVACRQLKHARSLCFTSQHFVSYTAISSCMKRPSTATNHPTRTPQRIHCGTQWLSAQYWLKRPIELESRTHILHFNSRNTFPRPSNREAA